LPADKAPADSRVVVWASMAFVPLWSSGILFGSLALRYGPPFAVTGLRFAAASAVLIVLGWWRRSPWPRGAALGHAIMVGLLLQGAHYAGIYAGLAAGMPAGVGALVVGLIPVATALGAAPILGERFTGRRALASLLGVIAAALVSWAQLRVGSVTVLSLAALALAGGAGAALWQKRFGGSATDITSSTVQMLVGTVVMAACWFALERGGRGIDWQPGFWAPFAAMVIGNSVLGMLLLMWLLARGAAGRVTGLFFLVPPFTALVAVPLLGEWPRPTTLVAILLGAGAVQLLMTERR
jgi:drug/metabolite transporter (DMT)-like permease